MDNNERSFSPIRLPLIGIPNQRGTDPLEDSRLVNGYAEQGLDGRWHVFKRPGIVEDWNSVPGGTSLGQGLFIESSGSLISVFKQPVSGVPTDVELRAWRDGVTIGQLYQAAKTLTPNNFGFFEGCLASVSADAYRLVISNGKLCFQIETAGPPTQIKFDDSFAGSLTCDTTNGSAIVTTADTSILLKYTSVSGAGIQADTLIESVDSGTQFTMTLPATATATVSLSFTYSGPPQSLLFPSSKSVLQGIPGVVSLNRSIYMAAPSGLIQGSDLDAPRHWDPLNTIYAYAVNEGSVAIAKQLSTIILLKESSAEFFRDAGTSPAPLARVEGLLLNTGCQDAHSVRAAGDVLIWSARLAVDQRAIWMIHKMQAKEVSTPAVRRIVSAAATGVNENVVQYGMTFSVGGHTLYVLKVPSGPAPVYDITAGIWYYWTALGEDHWPFVAAATGTDGTVYLQHETNGKIYKFDSTVFTDDSLPIDMDIIPPSYDGSTRKTKYCISTTVNADLVEGSELKLRVSDDDQQTWTDWRRFDLGHPRPRIERCGSFTRRHYHFRHSAPTACRLHEVELEIMEGYV